MSAEEKKAEPRKLICDNRRALHRYAFGQRLEGGLVLTGSEVKACRAGKAHLNDAYVIVAKNEALLLNAHIGEYDKASYFGHQPLRARKVLLNRKEIDRLEIDLQQRGLTAVPLSLYFKDGRVKVEIGLGKGKTQIDKRATIKERETERELSRVLRHDKRRARS